MCAYLLTKLYLLNIINILLPKCSSNINLCINESRLLKENIVALRSNAVLQNCRYTNVDANTVLQESISEVYKKT